MRKLKLDESALRRLVRRVIAENRLNEIELYDKETVEATKETLKAAYEVYKEWVKMTTLGRDTWLGPTGRFAKMLTGSTFRKNFMDYLSAILRNDTAEMKRLIDVINKDTEDALDNDEEKAEFREQKKKLHDMLQDKIGKLSSAQKKGSR